MKSNLLFSCYNNVHFLQFVLGYEVRKEGAPHNCLDDALAAMKLVLAIIERGVDNAIQLVQEDVSLAIWFTVILILIDMIHGLLFCFLTPGARKWKVKAAFAQDTHQCA